jgi:zinc protease
MKPSALLLGVALLAPAAAAAQQPGAAEAVRIDFVEETLPNGLKVIYHVDRTAPVAAVVLWYDVGSKHERAGRTGFAHLFEHVMFKGSRNVEDGQHFALLEAAGARSGADVNATTSFDRTNYFAQVPSNYLELALWLEADRLGTLLDVFTPEKLDNQREVVKNERRVGVDNQPYGLWFERMLHHAFPEGHPYRHPIIGFMADLDAATVDDVAEFFRTYYVPNNAVLVVAGDVDVDEARVLVRRHFAHIPRGAEPPPVPDARVPARIGETRREVVEDRNAPAPAVYVGYRMPNARDARGSTVTMLSRSLGSGRSNPLYERLVREQQIATNVGVFNLGLVEGSDLLVVSATGRPGASADSLEAAVLAELARATTVLTEADVERARADMRFQVINALQRTGGFSGRADMLAQAWTYHRNPDWVNTRLGALEAVTLAEIEALAAEQMVDDNRVILVFVPASAPSTPSDR